MPRAHRDTDVRYCSARTEVIGQDTVFVNGLLWAVEDDPEDHGAGNLRAVFGAKNIYINGKNVIVAVGDQAIADNFPHLPPLTYPLGKSPNVFAYEGSGTSGTPVVDQAGNNIVTDDGSIIVS